MPVPGSIKFNCVLIRHQTERELHELDHVCPGEADRLIRFIELMPVSTSEVLRDDVGFLACAQGKKPSSSAKQVL